MIRLLRRNLLWLIPILMLPLFLFPCQAAGETLYSFEDPVGDDYGPGTYSYPTAKDFKPFTGLFDLQGFSVEEVHDNYLFRFTFAELTDPWNGKFGYTMPLIELYIDNQTGGSSDLFKEGANVRLDPRYPWDKMLKISGWWVRLVTPADREDKNGNVDLSLNEEQLPWEIKDCQVEKEENEITLLISKDLIGPLKGAHLFLLVGGFDPFGFDNFRAVASSKASWSFSDEEHQDLRFAPRVIDLLLPEGYDQEKILGRFSDNYPLIYPVHLENGPHIYFYFRNKPIFFSVVAALLAMVLVLTNRKRLGLKK